MRLQLLGHQTLVLLVGLSLISARALPADIDPAGISSILHDGESGGDAAASAAEHAASQQGIAPAAAGGSVPDIPATANLPADVGGDVPPPPPPPSPPGSSVDTASQADSADTASQADSADTASQADSADADGDGDNVNVRPLSDGTFGNPNDAGSEDSASDTSANADDASEDSASDTSGDTDDASEATAEQENPPTSPPAPPAPPARPISDGLGLISKQTYGEFLGDMTSRPLFDLVSSGNVDSVFTRLRPEFGTVGGGAGIEDGEDLEPIVFKGSDGTVPDNAKIPPNPSVKEFDPNLVNPSEAFDFSHLLDVLQKGTARAFSNFPDVIRTVGILLTGGAIIGTAAGITITVEHVHLSKRQAVADPAQSQAFNRTINQLFCLQAIDNFDAFVAPSQNSSIVDQFNATMTKTLADIGYQSGDLKSLSGATISDAQNNTIFQVLPDFSLATTGLWNNITCLPGSPKGPVNDMALAGKNMCSTKANSTQGQAIANVESAGPNCVSAVEGIVALCGSISPFSGGNFSDGVEAYSITG